MNSRVYILPLMLAAFILMAGTALAKGFELPVSGQAKATLVEGPVTLQADAGAVPLKQGKEIKAPGKVSIGPKGRLELLLPDGSFVRFASGTEFALIKADSTPSGKRQVQVDVALGDAWAKVKGAMGEGSSFKINSPTATAGVAGTTYRLNVNGGQDSAYYVYEGKVSVEPWTPYQEHKEGQALKAPERVSGPSRVEGPKRVSMEEWLVIVSAGYQFNIRADGRYAEPVKFDTDKDRKDPWVKWNIERDKQAGFKVDY